MSMPLRSAVALAGLVALVGSATAQPQPPAGLSAEDAAQITRDLKELDGRLRAFRK